MHCGSLEKPVSNKKQPTSPPNIVTTFCKSVFIFIYCLPTWRTYLCFICVFASKVPRKTKGDYKTMKALPVLNPKLSQHTIFLKVNSSSWISLFLSHTGGQTPACLFLAPDLAVRYRLASCGRSHHTTYGFGQEGRGTMLCTRVYSNELPKR